MNQTAFDPAALLDLFEDDRAAIVELLEVAIVSIERDVRRIEDAVEHDDASALAAAAHSLKGASANIGCAALSSLCASLERSGVAGRAASDRPAIADLLAATGEVLAGIRSFCRDPAGSPSRSSSSQTA